MPNTMASVQTPETGSGRIAWFTAGVLTGVLASFLVYLTIVVPDDSALAPIAPTATVEDKAVEETDYTFYGIFPESEVPIIEEYQNDEKVRLPERSAYLLQAGSFRNPADADNLRARLLLLGLPVFARDISVEGRTWTRVLVGPLTSAVDLNRAQDMLAEASIESLRLRVTP